MTLKPVLISTKMTAEEKVDKLHRARSTTCKEIQETFPAYVFWMRDQGMGSDKPILEHHKELRKMWREDLEKEQARRREAEQELKDLFREGQVNPVEIPGEWEGIRFRPELFEEVLGNPPGSAAEWVQKQAEIQGRAQVLPAHENEARENEAEEEAEEEEANQESSPEPAGRAPVHEEATMADEIMLLWNRGLTGKVALPEAIHGVIFDTAMFKGIGFPDEEVERWVKRQELFQKPVLPKREHSSDQDDANKRARTE